MSRIVFGSRDRKIKVKLCSLLQVPTTHKKPGIWDRCFILSVPKIASSAQISLVNYYYSIPNWSLMFSIGSLLTLETTIANHFSHHNTKISYFQLLFYLPSCILTTYSNDIISDWTVTFLRIWTHSWHRRYFINLESTNYLHRYTKEW